MKDLLLVLGLVAGWFVLSRWVLPWLGVPTCMSGSCQAPACATGWEPAAVGQDDGAQPPGPADLPPAKTSPAGLPAAAEAGEAPSGAN